MRKSQKRECWNIPLYMCFRVVLWCNGTVCSDWYMKSLNPPALQVLKTVVPACDTVVFYVVTNISEEYTPSVTREADFMLPPNIVKKEDYFYLNGPWIHLSSSLKEPEKAVYGKGMHLFWLVPLHSVAITRVFFENCIFSALLESCTCLPQFT